MASKLAFAFFPYLVTSERFELRGITFRSNLDTEGIPEQIQDDLAILSRTFCLPCGVRIRKMTCTWLDLPDDERETQDCLRRLHECHLLISYLYCRPHSGGGLFMSSENCDLYRFVKDAESFTSTKAPVNLIWSDSNDADRLDFSNQENRPVSEYVPGFCGNRSGVSSLIAAKGSQIFPVIPFLNLNPRQDILRDLTEMLEQEHNWALRAFYVDSSVCPRELRNRVMLSLGWFIRSCRENADEQERIVNLAIALESLVHITTERNSKDQVTRKLGHAIMTLLGPLPKLDQWIGSFYDRRSEVVHQGETLVTAFIPSSGDSKGMKGQNAASNTHRSLLDYGLRVFRLCLATLLAGGTNARRVKLDSLFTTNAERLEEICKGLSEGDVEAPKRLRGIRDLVLDLRVYEGRMNDPDRVKLDFLLGAVRLSIKTLKEVDLKLSKPSSTSIARILSKKWIASTRMLTKLEKLAKLLRKELENTALGASSDLVRTVISLLEYATKFDFKIHFFRLDQQKGMLKSKQAEAN